MDASLRERLVEVLGRRSVLDGDVVWPTTAELVAAVVAVCAQTGTHFAAISGPAAEPRADAALLISLARLAVIEVDPGSLTLRAEAGATISAVEAAAEQAGLTLAATVGGPPPHPAHVGSLVVRGAIARRGLCGVEAVLATGERVASGGRVLKDVAGYDLAGVLLGSSGRLAVVTAATFRLQPAGTALETHESPGVTTPGPLAMALRTAFDPAGLLRAG